MEKNANAVIFITSSNEEAPDYPKRIGGRGEMKV